MYWLWCGMHPACVISFLSDLSVMWRTKTLEYLSQRIQRSKGSVDKRLLRSESILRVPWLTVAAVAMKDKSCAGPQPDPWTPDPICPGAGEPGQQQLEADTSSMYREVRVTTI